jgi:CIC family chloride channel protein
VSAPNRTDAPIMQPNVPASWTGAGFSGRFWGVLVLVGVGAGLGAIGLMALLRAVQHLAYSYSTGSFLDGVEHAPPDRRVIALVVAGGLAGVVWYPIRRFTKRGAGLLESLWQQSGRLPLVATIVNAVTEMVIVGLGASLGREGAPKDAAAAFASKLADLARLDAAERRLLVACGAGAGLAAVYNVPLGGALFALEVLLGTLALPLVLPAVGSCAIATAVAWLGLPDHPVYRIALVEPGASEIVWAALFGPLAGILAVGYVRMIAWAKTHRPSGMVLVPSTTLTFAALGGLALAYPQLLGNGLDLAQLLFSGAVALPLLAALTALRPLATGACLRSGALGGLLTPTLCAGALLGALAGSGWERLWPAGPTGGFAVLGATALLAAAMQAPLTAAVLAVELTNHLGSLLVPGLVVIAGASAVARWLDDRSIYTAPLRARRQPGRRQPGRLRAPVPSVRPIPGEGPPAPERPAMPSRVRVRLAAGHDVIEVGRWLALTGLGHAYRELPAAFRRDRSASAALTEPELLVAEESEGEFAGLALVACAPGADGRRRGALRVAVADPTHDEARAALVDAALRRLADAGCTWADAIVARADHAARRFYEDHGWELSLPHGLRSLWTPARLTYRRPVGPFPASTDASSGSPNPTP